MTALVESRLVVCSFGPDPRRTATLEAIFELGRCRRVFAARGTLRALRLLAIPGEPLRTQAVWRALRRKERVGIVVADGRLPRTLLDRCSRVGIPWRVLPAVSALDRSLARSGLVLGHDVQGLHSPAGRKAVRFLSGAVRSR